MSLTVDLMVKALEVSAATFVGNSVAGTGGKFVRKKARAVKADTTASDAEKLIGTVVEFAGRLPALVEAGGPEGRKWVKLAICIVIDLVGSGSLAVPIFGDVLDLATAPVTATMLQALFGSSLVTFAGFAEEILPGTDGIPTATLAWIAENNGYLEPDENGEPDNDQENSSVFSMRKKGNRRTKRQ